MINYASVLAAFTKLVPAFNAVAAALPGLISTEAADVKVASEALAKAIADLQAGLIALQAAVKAATA